MDCKYNNSDTECMKVSALARNKSRIKELINFAKISGYKKLGIANCISVQSYADKLYDILTDAGFEVVSINCKNSGIDGASIAPELAGPTCDPLYQAEYLNSQNTDFNINVGLCLGHGLIFQKHSKADVTTLIVKDMMTHHKVIENLE